VNVEKASSVVASLEAHAAKAHDGRYPCFAHACPRLANGVHPYEMNGFSGTCPKRRWAAGGAAPVCVWCCFSALRAAGELRNPAQATLVRDAARAGEAGHTDARGKTTALAAVFLRVKISPESTGQTSRLSTRQSGQKG